MYIMNLSLVKSCKPRAHKIDNTVILLWVEMFFIEIE